MWANKRTHELPWELRKLAGRLDGGERGRRAPTACGGVNGAGRLGVARRGEEGGFYRRPGGFGVTMA
jgi:hypothetical protein